MGSHCRLDYDSSPGSVIITYYSHIIMNNEGNISNTYVNDYTVQQGINIVGRVDIGIIPDNTTW